MAIFNKEKRNEQAYSSRYIKPEPVKCDICGDSPTDVVMCQDCNKMSNVCNECIKDDECVHCPPKLEPQIVFK